MDALELTAKYLSEQGLECKPCLWASGWFEVDTQEAEDVFLKLGYSDFQIIIWAHGVSVSVDITPPGSFERIFKIIIYIRKTDRFR